MGNPTGIRIVELPSCKTASSSGVDLATFDAWWTDVDKGRKDQFYPRDFMHHDRAMWFLSPD